MRLFLSSLRGLAAVLGLLATLQGAAAHAAITIDGRLDEPEWQTAQHFSAFTTTVPNTQNEPALRTLVYTRRIGAAPDAGNAGSSDILG